MSVSREILLVRRHTGEFNIEEVDVVRRRVDHSPECHGISDLAMEPDVLISGEEPRQVRTNHTDDVAKHGHKNQASIECQDQSCTARGPNRPFQPVERSKLGVDCLGTRYGE